MTTHPDDPASTPAAPGAEGCGGGLPAELTVLRGRVTELAQQTLLAARSPAELMDTVAEIETLKSTLDAIELAVVRELDATNAVKPVGWASTQDFLTAVSGGTKATGPAAVKLAKAVTEPLMVPVGDALADGWLSTTKAHVIRRAVDELPGDPDLRSRAVTVLLDEAQSLDATELRKLTHRLLAIVDPDGDDRRAEQALAREERAAHLGRFLTITDDHAGGAFLKGRCSTEDAAFLKATLMPLAAPQPASGPTCDPGACEIAGCSHDGRDPRDHGARMFDALTELCHRAQTADLLPTSHGASPRLSITIDYADLKNLAGFGETDTGEMLSPSAIRMLCCDAEVLPVVLGGPSGVLDVGRQMRLASVALWKALVARDKHCRFNHCTKPPVMCHVHHIVAWVDGGGTSPFNTLLLCGHHHRLIHSGPWEIVRTGPTTFEFHPPPGTRTITATGRPPPRE